MHKDVCQTGCATRTIICVWRDVGKKEAYVPKCVGYQIETCEVH